jgi:hypothetical protein
MTTTPLPPSLRTTHDALARERRVDTLIRTVCVTAWSITFAVAAGYAALVWTQVAQIRAKVAVGVLSSEAVVAAILPLVMALGVLTLLIAALTTVGVFLRFRGATLHDIQLRLAALEDMITRAP